MAFTRSDGTSVFRTSNADRGIMARRVARWPLRKVVSSGVGVDRDHPHRDVDLLECGHILAGAEDLVGRRWPERRRCTKCEPKPCQHEWKPLFGGGDVCLICQAQRNVPEA